MYPFGRRKFEPELLPLLDAGRREGPAPGRVQPARHPGHRPPRAGYDERVAGVASFDAILVHADPRLPGSRSRSSRGRRSRCRSTTPASSRHRRRTVASDGCRACSCPPAAAWSASPWSAPPYACIVSSPPGPASPRRGARPVPAGPGLARLQEEAAASPLLEAVRRVDDLFHEMRLSAVSLSQCGYNSTMDLLRARTPAVVVPFAEGGEDEQRRRAERLAALGVVPDASGNRARGDRRLVEELCAAAGPPRRPGSSSISMGQAATARIVSGLVTGAGWAALSRDGTAAMSWLDPVGASLGPWRPCRCRCFSATTTPAGRTTGWSPCSTLVLRGQPGAGRRGDPRRPTHDRLRS